jgi:integral membrane protein
VTGALLRFRVLAWIVGTLLLLLTLGVVLRYGFDRPTLSRTVSPVHGFMFIVYLVAMGDLGRRVGWPVKRMLVLALAGVVPVLSFVAERGVTRELRARTH